MKADMFLKLGDIKGESVDDKHKGEIDIYSAHWEMSQSATMHMGTGGGSGKVKVGNLVLTKYVDKSSPMLRASCCTGKHFDSAVFTVRKAGENPLEYLKFTLKEVLIADVKLTLNGGTDNNAETITLNFAQYMEEYIPQKADGSGDAAVAHGFNISQNMKL